MFDKKNFNIKEIYSVALIEPRKHEKNKIYYGDYIPRCELIYKLSGEVITHFNNDIHHIRQGITYIIPKSNTADYYIERTIPGDCIDIFFDTDLPLEQHLYILDFKDNTKVFDLFQEIYMLWLTRPSGYYFKCMSIMYEILYEMLLKYDQYSPKCKYNVLEPGIEYIHSNLYGTIDYYIPSKLCDISYTYFKKLFIERFGVPPIQYVNALRLERSKELLLTNKYSVNEIARMCGFENTYYFSRRFKEKYHLSPTAYKNISK